MLLSHYVPRMFTALFGGLFIFLGIYTLGNGLLFDRIFIGVLIFTAFICRKNVNVLGVIAILVIQRLLEESAWFISEQEFKTAIKALFYTSALFTWYKIKYDPTSRMLAIALILSLSSELYWYLAGKGAPEIYWYVGLAAVCLFTRHLLFLRVSYTDDFYPGRAESINLDWHVFKLYAVSIAVQVLMLIEYIVRSVFGFVEILYFYKLYPYLAHSIGTYTIWIIFNESYRLLLPKLLKA